MDIKKSAITRNYIAEEYDTLVEFANKDFLNGLIRFPEYASLHISYAFFLLEFMNSRHLAMEELNIAKE